MSVSRSPGYSGAAYSSDNFYTKLLNGETYSFRNYMAIGARTAIGLSSVTPPEGVIYHRSKTGFLDITDSTSNTVMILETREERASVWIDGSCAVGSA